MTAVLRCSPESLFASKCNQNPERKTFTHSPWLPKKLPSYTQRSSTQRGNSPHSSGDVNPNSNNNGHWGDLTHWFQLGYNKTSSSGCPTIPAESILTQHHHQCKTHVSWSQHSPCLLLLIKDPVSTWRQWWMCAIHAAGPSSHTPVPHQNPHNPSEQWWQCINEVEDNPAQPNTLPGAIKKA